MKIALAIERFDPAQGGAEKSTQQIAHALIAHGHTVTLVCNATPPPEVFKAPPEVAPEAPPEAPPAHPEVSPARPDVSPACPDVSGRFPPRDTTGSRSLGSLGRREEKLAGGGRAGATSGGTSGGTLKTSGGALKTSGGGG